MRLVFAWLWLALLARVGFGLLASCAGRGASPALLAFGSGWSLGGPGFWRSSARRVQCCARLLGGRVPASRLPCSGWVVWWLVESLVVTGFHCGKSLRGPGGRCLRAGFYPCVLRRPGCRSFPSCSGFHRGWLCGWLRLSALWCASMPGLCSASGRGFPPPGRRARVGLCGGSC